MEINMKDWNKLKENLNKIEENLKKQKDITDELTKGYYLSIKEKDDFILKQDELIEKLFKQLNLV